MGGFVCLIGFILFFNHFVFSCLDVVSWRLALFLFCFVGFFLMGDGGGIELGLRRGWEE